jgi:hypothetical protein
VVKAICHSPLTTCHSPIILFFSTCRFADLTICRKLGSSLAPRPIPFLVP